MTINKQTRLATVAGTAGIAGVVAVVAFAAMGAEAAYAQPQPMIVIGGEGTPMDNETMRYVKDYLISVINNNLTNTMRVSIGTDGDIVAGNYLETIDNIGDDIMISIANTPFSQANGYSGSTGELIAPNGTVILPSVQSDSDRERGDGGQGASSSSAATESGAD